MGLTNDDISLKLAKSSLAGFFPDVSDGELVYLDRIARELFSTDSILSAMYGNLTMPSSDTTGVTDVAKINASLLIGNTTLRGNYYINAPIRVSSDRSLTLIDANIYLVPGSNCNAIQNYNQNSTGDTNITLRGIGKSTIDAGNSTTQTTASAYNSIGVTWTHVTNLKVKDLKIGPCRGPVMVLQGVIHAEISGIDLAQDRTGSNQDGIDIGAACDDIVITNITGISGDDAFSIFSQKTAGFAHSLYKAVSGVAGTKNVNISNVSINVGINPVRLQAGDGLTLNGVHISNFRNTNPADSLYAVLMFGSVAYVTTPPVAADMYDISLDNYHGPGNVIIGTGSNFSYVTVSNIHLTGPWKTFLGTEQSGTNYAATTEQLHFENITTDDLTTTPTILNTPSGQSHSGVTVINAKIRRLGNVLNNGGVITGLFMNNIYIRSITGQVVRSSSVEVGQIDNVFIQSSSSGTYYLVNACRLRMGPNMPFVRIGDTTPDVTTKGSIITCAAGKDPTGGVSTTGGQYVASGTAWVKTADLGASF